MLFRHFAHFILVNEIQMFMALQRCHTFDMHQKIELEKKGKNESGMRKKICKNKKMPNENIDPKMRLILSTSNSQMQLYTEIVTQKLTRFIRYRKYFWLTWTFLVHFESSFLVGSRSKSDTFFEDGSTIDRDLQNAFEKFCTKSGRAMPLDLMQRYCPLQQSQPTLSCISIAPLHNHP